MELPSNMSVDVLKLYLSKTGTAADQILEDILKATVRFAEGFTVRRFFPSPELVVIEPPGSVWIAEDTADPVVETVEARGFTWFRVPDAREIVSVTATLWGVDQPAVTFEPDEYRTVTGLGGTIVEIEGLADKVDEVAITGRFGFTELPEDLTDAIYTHAARNYLERDALYGDSVALTDQGGLINFFRVMPPRVRSVYEQYQVYNFMVA